MDRAFLRTLALAAVVLGVTLVLVWLVPVIVLAIQYGEAMSDF